MLKGKNIVMGVTGGIAAWKACLILNKLVIDLHANVDVIMTKNSETFITEQTIRTLSRNIVTRDMFKEPAVWSVEHISLARKADCFLIALRSSIARSAPAFTSASRIPFRSACDVIEAPETLSTCAV